jgi:alcohol dehydrogenase
LHADLASAQLAISPTPTAHFGAGSIARLGSIISGIGPSDRAVIVTDAGLAATLVIAAVRAAAEEAGLSVTVFSGVHANPSTDDVAAGAALITETAGGFGGSSPRASTVGQGQVTLIAVGGGSSIDAAKGISIAAVNPERGRDLDYRSEFGTRGLPIIAIPPRSTPSKRSGRLSGLT